MSTQFIKWWKAKFQSSTTCGYKNIAVLGSDTSDGKGSDTEDLMRDDTSSTGHYHGAHINAGLATSSASSEHSKDDYSNCSMNQVKFEDFECDVQVEGNEPGESRKEFSFTFYDLDGHGKVTKDDIAGLVRSIYGAVNESIRVPQGGKKTIKVRLTVTPEKEACDHDCRKSGRDCSETPKINNTNNNNVNNTNNSANNKCSVNESRAKDDVRGQKLRSNLNVTIQENLKSERRFRHGDRLKFSSVRIPNHVTGCRGCRNLSPEVVRDCSASPMRHRKKWRERSCSANLQRPNLIELVQANMEKNNVSPCCRQSHHVVATGCGDGPCVPPGGKESFTPNNLSGCGKLKFHLDHHHSFMCHARNNQNKFYNLCNHHGVRNNAGHAPAHHQCKKHHRSRSHDLGQSFFKYHLLLDQDQTSQQDRCPDSGCNNNNNQNTSPQINENSIEENLELLNGCLFSKTSNIDNNTASPHQLKHRNREQEHARAMAQVISWLERDIGIEKKFPKKSPLHVSPPVVNKHEHHHIHEHVHHHYHHYAKETSIIV